MTLLTYKTKDRDKGITRITYNNIGLVDSILFDNGAKELYTYGVNGEKLRVRHYAATSNVISHVSAIRPGTNTIRYSEEEYIGGEIVKSGSVSGPSSTPPTYKYYFGDGYISFKTFFAFGSTNAAKYYYYSKDHLGNVRSVVTKNTNTNAVTEVQKTHYYPFGGIIADLSTGCSVQNRLYNGKELDTSNNLWWYDYGARQYDPTAPRFTTADPLAEKYYGWNMYMYCVNNPVKYIDHEGKDVWLFATKLPGASYIPLATHTFIVVKDKQGNVSYAAYGPSQDWVFGGDKLTKCTYDQDVQVYQDYFKNTENDALKKAQKVNVPDGMTSEQFDEKVIETIQSFGNQDGITYSIRGGYSTDKTIGNCNSSSSTILLKSGVNEKEMERLEEGIPGIKWGFQTKKPKPWTKTEQIKALKAQEIFDKCNLLQEPM